MVISAPENDRIPVPSDPKMVSQFPRRVHLGSSDLRVQQDSIEVEVNIEPKEREPDLSAEPLWVQPSTSFIVHPGHWQFVAKWLE